MSANTRDWSIPSSPHHLSLVVERIQQLKERLSDTQTQMPKSAGLFRLGYTILMLEKSLKERRLFSLKLVDAPAICRFLDQLDHEIGLVASEVSHVRDRTPVLAQSTKDPAGFWEEPCPDAGKANIADQLAVLIAELRAMQKWQKSESRRLSASFGAQYSAIERLAERMTRLEARLNGSLPVEERLRQPLPTNQPAGPDYRQLDPRPMLAAARAAAARTFVPSLPSATELYSAGDHLHEPTDTKQQPEAIADKVRRGLKFFSAA